MRRVRSQTQAAEASEAAEEHDQVLVEALVVSSSDLTHSRVEAVVCHVRLRSLGRADEGVAEAVLAAGAPAARRTEHCHLPREAQEGRDVGCSEVGCSEVGCRK